MSNALNIAHFIAYHSLFLIVYFVAIGFSWKAISRLRDAGAAYTARLPFAYYSLTAWILWVLHYLVIIAWSFLPSSGDVLLGTALWFGVVQNALWATATFSLYSKIFPRWSLTLPLLIGFSILIALVDYRIAFLSSLEFTTVEALLSVAVFTALALSIRQFGLGKAFVAAFVIHGLSQWIWRGLLFSTSPTTRLALLLGLPIWHSALLLVWMKVTPRLLEITQTPDELSVGPGMNPEGVDHPTPLVKPKESMLGNNYTDANVELILLPFRVMISSTVDDLVQERNAAENAIKAIHLESFLAETVGSRSHTPRKICEAMAKECDIFILIIGERYGYIIEPERISVVEFEFGVAQKNKKRILVYVKVGVAREPRLEEFLDRVGNFESGSFWYLFGTPEELSQKIQRDVIAYLTGQAKRVEGH